MLHMNVHACKESVLWPLSLKQNPTEHRFSVFGRSTTEFSQLGNLLWDQQERKHAFSQLACLLPFPYFKCVVPCRILCWALIMFLKYSVPLLYAILTHQNVSIIKKICFHMECRKTPHDGMWVLPPQPLHTMWWASHVAVHEADPEPLCRLA